MTTDRLGNLYLSNDNFLWRYDNNGDSIGAFNSKRYGEITFVDVTDPYQILVFFKDYNQVLYLDNYLTVNGDATDLQSLGYDQVSMVCQSREKGIWIFDQIKQKAYRLNSSLKVTHETVNLAQWFGKRILPNYMIEYNNKLYLNEKESGLYVFDHFATYLNKIPVIGNEQVQLMDDKILYFQADSNKLCQYKLKDFRATCEKLDATNCRDARVEKNRLFILKPKEAVIFKTN